MKKKTAIKGLVGIVVAGTAALALWCNSFSRSPRTHKYPTSRTYDAEITTLSERVLLGYMPSEELFHFEPKKPGLYIIEGWINVHRDDDKFDKLESFVVKEGDLPTKKEIRFNPAVYRIEITYVDGETVERTRLRCPRTISNSGQ
ncbi:hypothetical protein KY342_03540 [Candidatus Woesearchaeota archaeon]|nr:hypothetical protein [Candidatus Woesearchaeota archaeon]